MICAVLALGMILTTNKEGVIFCKHKVCISECVQNTTTPSFLHVMARGELHVGIPPEAALQLYNTLSFRYGKDQQITMRLHNLNYQKLF